MATKTVKAYKNEEFLNSPDARTVRILSEYLEPGARFNRRTIKDTVVFFGSARTLPRDEAQRRLDALKKNHAADAQALRQAERDLHMSRYYEDAAELARLVAEWSKSTGNSTNRRFTICSGGGPGIMEAANRGAAAAAAESIGFNISLPFEQQPNPYSTPELTFEFHYFFVRKFWFVYLAKALIVFPGGFGTIDEMMELLTLVQTGKIKKKMPIIIYGSDFWKEVLNFDALVKWGVICPEDLRLFRFADSPQEAFAWLQANLEIS